ncbi:MAG TPA: hypothetical protein VJ123_04335 [Anaerolineales bacterium]|nr:hypothetical protein [Anaerolineales bacterium]
MASKPSFHPRRLSAALGWTKTSLVLMGSVAGVMLMTVLLWWPLVVEYFSTYDASRSIFLQLDWMLVAVFGAMFLLIMAGADLERDALVILVGTMGGLVIESWGTQTQLWTYYTQQRPPLWIIPAWPVASLAIDRLFRFVRLRTERQPERLFKVAYWLILPLFYALMLVYVWPTLDKSLTRLALVAVGLLIVSPVDERAAVLTFLAGAGLGYFLELWGTTRACWTYYTLETPPAFAVLAHGMAAVAFWRVGRYLVRVSRRLTVRAPRLPLLRE